MRAACTRGNQEGAPSWRGDSHCGAQLKLAQLLEESATPPEAACVRSRAPGPQSRARALHTRRETQARTARRGAAVASRTGARTALKRQNHSHVYQLARLLSTLLSRGKYGQCDSVLYPNTGPTQHGGRVTHTQSHWTERHVTGRAAVTSGRAGQTEKIGGLARNTCALKPRGVNTCL